MTLPEQLELQWAYVGRCFFDASSGRCHQITALAWAGIEAASFQRPVRLILYLEIPPHQLCAMLEWANFFPIEKAIRPTQHLTHD
jgi:hypothetical protein